MINKTEYLLLCLAEEFGECQKEIIKCIRFGLHNSPDNTKSNFERLNHEWCDMLALVELLMKEDICLAYNSDLVKSKKKRVEYYMNRSKEFGILE